MLANNEDLRNYEKLIKVADYEMAIKVFQSVNIGKTIEMVFIKNRIFTQAYYNDQFLTDAFKTHLSDIVYKHHGISGNK